MQKDFYEEIVESLKNDITDEFAPDVYENVNLSDDINCPLIAVNNDGVFILMDGTRDDAKKIRDLTPILHLNNATYVWVVADDQDWFFDAYDDEFVPADDIYMSFFSVFYNVCSGQVNYKTSLKEYAMADHFNEIEVLVHDPAIKKNRREVIASCIVEKQTAEEETGRKLIGKEYKTVDGVTYIRKADYLGRDQWYPISEELDPEDMYEKCLYGGIFGAHKFVEGRILTGMLYLITLSCFGVFWLSDIFTMLTGNYRLKDGSYLGSVKKNKDTLIKTLAGFAIGAVLMFGAVKAVQWGAPKLNSVIAEQAETILEDRFNNMSDEELQKYADKYGVSVETLKNLSKDDLETIIDAADSESTETSEDASPAEE